MKLFSQQSDTPQEGDSQNIPEEIRQSVSVMGSPMQKAPLVPSESSAHPISATPAAPQKESPFLSVETTASAPVAPPEEPKAPVTKSLAPVWNPPVIPELKPLFDDEAPLRGDRPIGSPRKWVIAGVIVLVLASGAGGWYYLSVRTGSPTPPPASTIEAITPEVKVVVTAEPPYSLTMPNYLSIDTETVTTKNFRDTVKQAGDRMIAANMTAPVEFLLTDKNNNPIAFSRFAYLMTIGVKSEFLEQFDESFSLFLFPEGGKIRLGLGLVLTPTAAGDLFKVQKEGTVPFAFQTLLYDDAVTPKNVIFRSGTYQGTAVRYVNIDPTSNTSFDHALRGKKWFIGTSKDTLRAILDKQGQ